MFAHAYTHTRAYTHTTLSLAHSLTHSLTTRTHIHLPHTSGQRYLDEQFPELSYIETARVLDPAEWKDIEEVAADAGLVKKSGTQEKKEKTEETEEEEENAKVEL